MAKWLTLEETADYLKMGKSTIYKLARGDSILAHKYGRIWRFDASELDEWLKQSPDIVQLSQSGLVSTSSKENKDGKETETS